MPASIDREKMVIDLSPVKRCLCWLSPLVSRLHLAEANQNTNTPLSFGCAPSHPPPLPLFLINQHFSLDSSFSLLFSFISQLLGVCDWVYGEYKEFCNHVTLLSPLLLSNLVI